ncbi:MAG TPA: hypothetical protein VFS10_02265 [Pyrinomonadaceae bacterium]|nr:hypothetical protein [Pyrinomonadaceae bacterium]
MKRFIRLMTSVLALLLVVSAQVFAQDDTEVESKRDSAAVARRLSSRNAFERREAAEEIARLAATEHRRLVEGYRVQEKDARVQVAMDWALYRLGKGEAIYPLVRALDSKQADQVVKYLSGLETPAPLYAVLPRVNGNTQIRLLEVLAHVGDRETLEQIKPYTASLDPGIADAAKFAEREITIRLEETPAPEPKRQRQVSKGETSEP